jgi:hypothetical protein
VPRGRGPELCAIPDCDHFVWARGWCPMHYSRWRIHGSPLVEPPSRAQRFWKYVQKTGESPGACWLWTGGRHRHGHGAFRTDGGKQIAAHRFAYELLVAPIPPGLVLDHLCMNPPCVNPVHLEPVTMRENTLRGNGFAARNARKTHCPLGHPYDLVNTYVSRAGERQCQECIRIRSKGRWQREVTRRSDGTVVGYVTPPSISANQRDRFKGWWD